MAVSGDGEWREHITVIIHDLGIPVEVVGTAQAAEGYGNIILQSQLHGYQIVICLASRKEAPLCDGHIHVNVRRRRFLQQYGFMQYKKIRVESCGFEFGECGRLAVGR